MPVPVYEGAGTGHASAQSLTLNVGYPSVVNSGDILLLHAFLHWGGTVGTPDGWTLIHSSSAFWGGDEITYLWMRIADGTEGGTTEPITRTGGWVADGWYARMYRYSGAVTYEGLSTESQEDVTNVLDTAVTTAGPNRLALNIIAYNKALTGTPDFTGETGGTWVFDTSVNSTTGLDCTLRHFHADMASAGTINGGDSGTGSAKSYINIGLALVAGNSGPIGLAVETDTALSITPQLSPAGVYNYIGQAVEQPPTVVNLIQNHGAETDLNYWGGHYNDLTRDTSRYLFGVAGFKMTSPVDAAERYVETGGVSGYTTMTPGSTYTFSAWVYVPSDGGLALNEVWLELWDRDDPSDHQMSPSASPTAYNEWQRLTVTRTIRAAADAAFARITMEPTNVGDHFYFDGVQLELGSGIGYYFGSSAAPGAMGIVPLLTSPDINIYTAIDFGHGFEQFEEIRARSIVTRRGRSFNLEKVVTGTGTAVFSNGDGLIDPAYLSGVHYGEIHPLIPIRILRREGGITYERFTGPIERFEPDWSLPTYQEMKCGASDNFEGFSQFLLESDHSTLTTNLTGTNNDLVFTAVEAGGQGDDISISYVVAGTNTPLAGETNDPLQGAAIVVTHPSGSRRSTEFLGSLFGSRKTAPPTEVSVQGSDISITVATDGSGNPISTASQIKAAIEANAAISALVSVELAPGNTGAGVVTAMSKVNLTGGKWPQEMSGARINRILDLVGWPTELRSIDAGNYEVVAQGFALKEDVSALTHMQDVADSELGYIFMKGNNVFTYHDASHRNVDERSTASRATFSNLPGTGFDFNSDIQLSLDKEKIVNEATVTGGSKDSVPQTAENLYSQTGTGTPPVLPAPTVPPNGYGKRAISRKTLLANDSDCLVQANLIVEAFAYPLERLVKMSTSEPVEDESLRSAWVAAVMDLDIGDQITVVIRPPGKFPLSTTSYALFVEEVADELAPATPWKVTFSLSPVAQSVSAPPPPGIAAILNRFGDPLIVGDATQGKIGD